MGTEEPRTGTDEFAPDVISLAQAAELCGVSQMVVLKRIARGDIVARKMGGTWIVSKESARGSVPRVRGNR